MSLNTKLWWICFDDDDKDLVASWRFSPYFWCQSWHHFLVCDTEVLAHFLSGPLWFLTTAFLNLEFTLAPGLRGAQQRSHSQAPQTVLKALLFYQPTPKWPSQDCDHGGNGGDSNSAPITLPISPWPISIGQTRPSWWPWVVLIITKSRSSWVIVSLQRAVVSGITGLLAPVKSWA